MLGKPSPPPFYSCEGSILQRISVLYITLMGVKGDSEKETVCSWHGLVADYFVPRLPRGQRENQGNHCNSFFAL